jgi:hypothetical protein
MQPFQKKFINVFQKPTFYSRKKNSIQVNEITIVAKQTDELNLSTSFFTLCVDILVRIDRQRIIRLA